MSEEGARSPIEDDGFEEAFRELELRAAGGRSARESSGFKHADLDEVIWNADPGPKVQASTHHPMSGGFKKHRKTVND